MKLTPCSRARATIRDDVASSVAPPNIIVPRQSGETFSPLTPSRRYSMPVLPLASGHLTPDRSNWSHADSLSHRGRLGRGHTRGDPSARGPLLGGSLHVV